jgi:hypothetical protein
MDASAVEKLKRKPPAVETNVEKDFLERDYRRLQEKVDFYLKMISNKNEKLLQLRADILKAKTPEEKRRIMQEAEKLIGLGEQNNEFEAKVETEKNDPLLFEKAEAGMALLDEFKKNPDALKIENFKKLNPEDFVTNPVLLEKIKADPSIWIEIKTKARSGLAMREVINSKGFKNPLTDKKSRDLLLRAGKEDAENLLDVVKKNPQIIVGVVLLAGAFWLFNKFKKTKSSIGLGLASLLCLSSFGKEFLGDIEKHLKEGWGIKDQVIKKGKEMAEKAKAEARLKVTKHLNPETNKQPRPKQEKPDDNQIELSKDERGSLEKIKARSLEESIFYRWLISYKKLSRAERPTIAGKYIDQYITKIEKGELKNSEKAQLAAWMFTNEAVVYTTSAGISLLALGGLFAIKIAKEELKLCKNIGKLIFSDFSPKNVADSLAHYGKNAILLFGIGTAQELALSLASKHEYGIGRVLLRGAFKGAVWPVYSLDIGARMASRSAKILGSKYLLVGKIKFVGNTFKVIDASGRIVSSIAAKTLLNKKGSEAFMKEAQKTLSQRVFSPEIQYQKSIQAKDSKGLKKAITEKMNQIKKGSPGISEKALRKKAIADLKKSAAKNTARRTAIKKTAKGTLETTGRWISKIPKPIKIVGGRLLTAWMAKDIAEFGKEMHVKIKYKPQEKILYEEVKKRRKLLQSVGSKGHHNLGMNSDFGLNYLWSGRSMREEGTLAEAIRAANTRIQKELPGTPLFEIPPELQEQP